MRLMRIGKITTWPSLVRMQEVLPQVKVNSIVLNINQAGAEVGVGGGVGKEGRVLYTLEVSVHISCM